MILKESGLNKPLRRMNPRKEGCHGYGNLLKIPLLSTAQDFSICRIDPPAEDRIQTGDPPPPADQRGGVAILRRSQPQARKFIEDKHFIAGSKREIDGAFEEMRWQQGIRHNC